MPQVRSGLAGWTAVSIHIGLPEYLHEHSQVLIEKPIRIVSIIVVALIVRFILHRMINRLARMRVLDPARVQGRLVVAIRGNLRRHWFWLPPRLVELRRRRRGRGR